MDGTVNADSSVYYQPNYWNDLELVRRHLNRRATGDPDVRWFQHLAALRGRPFERALVLNCGNGWVERDLVQEGVIKEAVGIDFSDDLLAQAREHAERDQLPLEYLQADINEALREPLQVDLVVNNAAAHHIAYIDRVFRRIHQQLPEDGIFVSWDYLGPHRNQYTAAQWEAAYLANLALPEQFRQDMVYPHLPTMLHDDPTEAIHSELILPTMRRYFELDHVRHLGGGVAYPLLTFNKNVHGRPEAEVEQVVEQVLRADEEFTDRAPEENSLFGYVVARPRPGALDDQERLARWTAEEDERERRAAADGGRYYPPTLVADLVESVDRARLEAARAGSAGHGQPGQPGNPGHPGGTPGPLPPRFAALRRVARHIPGARPVYRRLRARVRR